MFIWFGDYGFRPALIAFGLYLLMMGGFLIFGNCRPSWEKQSRPVLCRKSLLYVLLLALFFIIRFYQGNKINEETWISNVLENYLKIEDLLVAVLLLGTVLGCTFRENAHQFLDVVLKIVRVVCVFSLYGNFLTGLCAFTFLNTVILLVIWVVLIATAGWNIISSSTDDTKMRSSYAPIESYEDLSANFKRIADRLVSIVETDTSSTYSICLAGDWGMGKTSIIHGLEHRLKEGTKQREKQGNDAKEASKEVDYRFIYINALELDTAESLFHYLFSRIKQILKEEGVYVGLGSTYRKFIGSAVDMITQSSLSILLEGELFAQNEDYRVQKKALSALIARAMNNGRIIVVVDDIERCHKDKIKDYLFFVKEIASMERCVPIFVTDYNRLVEQIKESDENPHVFLDKFFNYTVHVTCSAVEDVIAEMQKQLDKVVAVTSIPYIQKANIEDVIEGFRKKLTSLVSSEQEKDDNTKSEAENDQKTHGKTLTPQEKVRNKFQSDMNNTRTVVHVCTKMIHYYKVLGNQYGNEKTRTIKVLDAQIEKYGEQIELHNVIFLIAYVECCMPLEFSRMAKSCYDYIFRQKHETEEYLEVLTMAQDLIFQNGTWLGKREEGINTNKALEFVSTLVKQPQMLLEIVDWYENKIQKAKTLLLTGQFSKIDSDWDEIMRRLLQEQYLNFGEVRYEDEKIVSKLMEFLKAQLDSGQITVSNILEAIMVSHYEKFFVSRVGFVEKLKDLVSHYPILTKEWDKLYHELDGFKVTYVWTWFNHYMKLIEFLSQEKVNWPDSINFWMYDYLGKKISTEEFVDKAIDKVTDKIRLFADFNFENEEGALHRLCDLTQYLCQRCSTSEEYIEIAYNLSYIRCAVGEIESLMKIESMIIKGDSKLQKSDFSDIGRCISYFESKRMDNRRMMGLFNDFVVSLETCTLENNEDNNKLIRKLHELLSDYLKQNQMNYTRYRRILCNLEERMLKGAEEDNEPQ